MPVSGRTEMNDIADIEWAKHYAPVWEVSTPSQFAGVVKYINDNKVPSEYSISIMRDLDLDEYEWLPIEEFSGNIDGRGHTISNIHLNTPLGNHNGIIGVNSGAIGVFNLKVENAEVNGGDFAGIIAGEGYMMNLDHVYASGRVTSDGQYAGALLGRVSPSMTYDTCSMNVYLNGTKAEFFSYTQENESHAGEYAKEIYKLTLSKSGHTVTRSEENYTPRNLGWRVIYNGEIVLERNAENELSYKYYREVPGTYEIYLTEYNSKFGGYVRVSNSVTYTIK